MRNIKCVHLCVHNCVSVYQGEVYQWTGNLSQAANTILHQHAIQGDITDVQQSMCRWCAYSRKHRVHPFDWSLLLKLLEDLDEKWEPASLNRDEVHVLFYIILESMHCQ